MSVVLFYLSRNNNKKRKKNSGNKEEGGEKTLQQLSHLYVQQRAGNDRLNWFGKWGIERAENFVLAAAAAAAAAAVGRKTEKGGKT